MRAIADLLETVEALVAPLLKGALLVGATAMLFVMLASRRACACMTKELAYATAMRVDLRNLAEYQESRRARGLTALDTLPDVERYRTSTGVALLHIRPTADGFVAEAAYPSRTANRCRVVHVWGTTPEPECYWTRATGRRAYPSRPRESRPVSQGAARAGPTTGAPVAAPPRQGAAG